MNPAPSALTVAVTDSDQAALPKHTPPCHRTESVVSPPNPVSQETTPPRLTANASVRANIPRSTSSPVTGETRRWQRWGWTTTGLVVLFLTVLLVLAHFPPDRHAFYPRCSLHVRTGFLCPGCGSLRALHALIRGDVPGALQSNLLLTAGLPLLGLIWLIWWWRRSSTSWMREFPGWLGWLALAVVFLFSLIRNLPGPVSGWFAP